jgi:hypothetical protein
MSTNTANTKTKLDLDIDVPPQYAAEMERCSLLLNDDTFADYVADRHTPEHKLYTEMATRVYESQSDEERLHFTERFCMACIIVVNVAAPEYIKQRNLIEFERIRGMVERGELQAPAPLNEPPPREAQPKE